MQIYACNEEGNVSGSAHPVTVNTSGQFAGCTVGQRSLSEELDVTLNCL